MIRPRVLCRHSRPMASGSTGPGIDLAGGEDGKSGKPDGSVGRSGWLLSRAFPDHRDCDRSRHHMNIVHSRKVQRAESSAKIAALLETIAETQLREWVERISVPRHFGAEPEQNRAVADWLSRVFDSMDYKVKRQGRFSNILALPDTPFDEVILVGAHYDSVPMCPGADDNGSAVAAMLGCAAACALWRPVLPIIFVAFNREEDGLRGSRDFVESYLPNAPFGIHCAHILEMVGYATSAPGSQRVP